MLSLFQILLLGLIVNLTFCATPTIHCSRKTPAFTCPSWTCQPRAYLDREKKYEANCYKYEPGPNGRVKWYYITLPKGDKAYIRTMLSVFYVMFFSSILYGFQSILYDKDPYGYDCIHYFSMDLTFTDIVKYCIRPANESNLFDIAYEDISEPTMTFDELSRLNVTSSDLLRWSSSIDLVERYQAYLDHSTVSNRSNEMFMNCTRPWFGSQCQYSFDMTMNFDDVISLPPTCYILLQCNRGDSTICLDWREICNGQIDCLNDGIDEIQCIELEMNECGENEYRCYNGLCIPEIFLGIESIEAECLDSSDYFTDLEYGLNLFHFEESQCRPDQGQFSCGNGQCVEELHECANQRHLALIQSISDKGNLSMNCWQIIACLSKILDVVDNIPCEEILETTEQFERCHFPMEFPTKPVLYGHIRFLYHSKNIQDINISFALQPDYICFDHKLCDFLQSNYSIRNLTCRSSEQMGLGSHLQFTTWKSMIDAVKPYFTGCTTRHYENALVGFPSTFYRCKNSSKSISKYRLMDGITDCHLNDDEQINGSCCLDNQTLRFQCPQDRQCRPSLYPRAKCLCDQEIHLSTIDFYQICDRIDDLPLLLIDGRNHSDETDCEHWVCKNMYTQCDDFPNCANGEDEMNCLSIYRSTTLDNENDTELLAINSTEVGICGRGLYVPHRLGMNNYSYVCFCPPNYYGDRCQYQNQRVSLTLSIATVDRPLIYAIVITLIDDDHDQEEIHSYHQLTYTAKSHCGKPLNIYLLYSTRGKNSSKNFTIRIDAFDKNSMTYLLTWYVKIPFVFLPVNRIAAFLTLPTTRPMQSILCTLQCSYGVCMKYHNEERLFCRCQPGWSGARCDIPIDCSMCAAGSICVGSVQNRSICICPYGKFGSFCRLKLTCPHDYCENQGRCFVIDERMINESYVCFCSEFYYGDRCEFEKSQIEISFQNIQFTSYFHIYLYSEPGFPELRSILLRKPTMFQISVTLYSEDEIGLIFIKMNNQYYLAIPQNSSPITITPTHQCFSWYEVLNAKYRSLPRIHRMKYYHLPCQENRNLRCFIDEYYMCLCTDEHYSNCFPLNHQSIFECEDNVYCENGGQCLQDQAICFASILCVCRDCFFGDRCQFYAKGMGLMLDDLLRYEIQPNTGFTQQSLIVQLSAAVILIGFIVGLLNSSCGYLVFRQQISRRVGSGIYLQLSSIISGLAVTLLVVKFFFIVCTYIDLSIHRNVLRIGCLLIEPCLRLLLYTNHWLNTCVAIERAVLVLQGVNFDRRRSRTIARRVCQLLPLILLASMSHELKYRDLFEDYEEQRFWCVLRYSPTVEKYTKVIQFIHFAAPFTINLISALLIIINITRQRSVIRHQRRYEQQLLDQFNEHKQLVISPIVMVVLLFPQYTRYEKYHQTFCIVLIVMSTSRKSSESNQQVDVDAMSQKQQQQADQYANDEIEQQLTGQTTTNTKLHPQQPQHSHEVNLNAMSQKQQQQAEQYAVDESQ
ncbi:unnamed protein product [Adineta ricciae]|uniref:EGF-like domain-containing protein n=3 Tax=Adineta ricciae TaxID=249248 RepID=A0A815KY41_ADIRI|nr:unnamed protein product [Adineta ricciae]